LSVNQNYLNFSRDFLIALWFAAHDNKGKNGKVFVLKINNIDKFSELQKGGKIFGLIAEYKHPFLGKNTIIKLQKNIS
jgi:hypothetical protein